MQQGAARSRWAAAIDRSATDKLWRGDATDKLRRGGRHTLLPIEQSSNGETTNVGGRGAHQVRIALATQDIPNHHASFLHGESCHAARTLSVAVLGFFGLSSDTKGV